MASSTGNEGIGLTIFAIASFLVAIFTIAYQMFSAWMDKRSDSHSHEVGRDATVASLMTTIQSMLSLMQNNTIESALLRQQLKEQTDAIIELTVGLERKIVVMNEVKTAQINTQTAMEIVEDRSADIPEIKYKVTAIAHVLDRFTAETIGNSNEQI